VVREDGSGERDFSDSFGDTDDGFELARGRCQLGNQGEDREMLTYRMVIGIDDRSSLSRSIC